MTENKARKITVVAKIRVVKSIISEEYASIKKTIEAEVKTASIAKSLSLDRDRLRKMFMFRTTSIVKG